MSAHKLEAILAEFKASGLVRSTRTGPVVYTHLVELGHGVRVRKVAALEDDIALRMGVQSVRVVTNVPGQPYLGVEVPREDRQIVHWGPPLSRGALPLALGTDTLGVRVSVDLARAPHLLVAGETGSGKSVAVHTMICSLLQARENVRFVLIDPKMLEFQAYRHCGKLMSPVITDAAEAASILRRLVREMETRYQILANAGCRDIGEFIERGGDMKRAVVVIDEWADLFAMQKDAVADPVIRLAQKSRAAGIHMILATQRPSVKVLPGLIKANFGARVALKVATQTDSRVVLDRNGAERLLGMGDMLVSGFGLSEPQRVHGAFVDAEEQVGLYLNNRRRQTS